MLNLRGRTRRLGTLGRRAVLLAGAALPGAFPVALYAQDASWVPGAAADFGTAARWSTNAVPTGVATFGGAGGTVTNVDLTGGLGAIVFAAGASPYSLDAVRGAITGAGIANLGTGGQVVSIAPAGTLTLSGTATVGQVTLNLGAGATLAFTGSANGGTSTVLLGGSGTLSATGVTTGFLDLGRFTAEAGSTLALGTNQLRLASGASVLGGQVTGSGGLAVRSGASIAVSAGQGFAGGTDITGGTVVLTNLGGLGGDTAAFSGATAGLLRLDAAGTFATPLTWNASSAGTIAAAAGRTVTLTGQLTLGAASTVRLGTAADTGTLIVSPGTVGFGVGYALSIDGGTVRDGGIFSNATRQAASTTIASGATLDFNDQVFGGQTQVQRLLGTGTVNTGSSAVTVLRLGAGEFAGRIHGAGGLRVADVGATTNGTLILTGTSTYAGTTTIDTGHTLQIGNGGTSGAIGAGAVVNDGRLVFNRADAVTFANVISGSGGVTQSGAGVLTLSGNNTYTGATAVDAGALVVNGSIAASSGLTIGNGAVLGGNATLPSTVVAAGAVIAPGNSVGVVTINGNLTLAAGGTLVMEVLGATADRINVTGTASLAGNLRLVAQGGPYRFNTAYTLVSASAVTGALAAVSTEGSFGVGILPTVSQTTTALELRLAAAPQLGPFTAYNLVAAAGALSGVVASGRDLSPFFNVYNQPAATLGAAVNQLTGEVATAGPEIGLLAGEQFLAAMLDPFAYGREALIGGRLRPDDAAGPAYAVWGSVLGAYRRNTGDAADGSATRSATLGGFALGVDRRVGDAAVIGAAIAVGEGRAGLQGGLGVARGDVAQAGLHGSLRLGSVMLAGAAAATWMDVETERTQSFLGGARIEGSGASRIWSLRGEARQDGAALGGLRLQPLGALQWQQVNSDSYREANASGSGAFGMNVAAASNTAMRTELGAQLSGEADLAGRPSLGFVRLAWGHYLLRDATMGVAFSAYPDAGFTVRGARRDADAALFSAGLETSLGGGLTLGARLDGEASAHVRQVAGAARLRYAF